MQGFVPEAERVDIVSRALALGVTKAGFFACDNEKTKNMRMMNLGRRMDSGAHDLAIPAEWQALARRAADAARAVEPSLPAMEPDVCVANLYSETSRLSVHQDVCTRRDPGAPVVSISLGLACDFNFQRGWGKKQKEHCVSRSHWRERL